MYWNNRTAPPVQVKFVPMCRHPFKDVKKKVKIHRITASSVYILECSNGYVLGPFSQCYKFSGAGTTMNWNEARAACQGEEGHLATPKTQQELDFVLGM